MLSSYSKCDCGAITLYFEDGNVNSIKEENLEKFDIELPEDELQKTYCCNHCVNHYGLDLCACGSGESPEDCKEGFSECGDPMEVLGLSVPFMPKI